MAKTILTDITLRKLAPPDRGQVEVWDAKLPGFGIRLTSAGTKSFVLVYRFAGRPRRLTIGRYPTLGLADARVIAQQALTAVAIGTDPQQEKREARQSTMFVTLVDEFIETHCRRHNKSSTAKETERILRADFIPKWRKKAIDEIRKPDVLRVIDDIVAANRPSAANHAFAAIRKFFNWCVQRGHLEFSPCLGIQSPAKQASRERVLDDGELARVWHGASRVGYPFGPIVHLLILTAQRRGEVASMRWSDLHLTALTWSIPAEMTKSNRAHIVPLTPFALSLIMTLPRLDEVWVFPARGDKDKSFIGFNKAKRRLDELITNAQLREQLTNTIVPVFSSEIQEKQIDNWTLHDLRRTAATGMAKLKVAPHIVERILNHLTGTLGGVTGIYNRFGYLDEMRAALEVWEKHLKAMLERHS